MQTFDDLHRREISLHTSLISALFSALTGLAVAGTVLTTDGRTAADVLWTALAATALLAHSVNFFHGAITWLSDAKRLVAVQGQPLLRLVGLYRSVGNFAALCVSAAGIASLLPLCLGELVLRVVDSTTLLYEAWTDRTLKIDKPTVSQPAEREHKLSGWASRTWHRSTASRSSYPAQRLYWILMNMVVTVWAVITIAAVIQEGSGLQWFGIYWHGALIFTLLVTVDLGVEYAFFLPRYSQSTSTWDEMAERWDRLQGERGDPARQTTIYPFLQTSLNAWQEDSGYGATEIVVVDAGCGNGSAVRSLRDLGIQKVVGFDGSERMIEIARFHEFVRPRGARYFVANLEDTERLRLGLSQCGVGQAHVIVALFSLQDCTDLDQALRSLYSVLAAGGLLVVITESIESLRGDVGHATTIRHIVRRGKKQIVTWLPVQIPAEGSVCGTDDEGVRTTVTNVRPASEIVDAAVQTGLTLHEGPIPLLPRKVSVRTIQDFRRATIPRFVATTFRRH